MVGYQINDDLEGSCHGLNEAMSRYFPRGTEETHWKTSVRIARVLTEIRIEHLSNRNLERYGYAGPFVTCQQSPAYAVCLV
jgi:hypothetical protein